MKEDVMNDTISDTDTAPTEGIAAALQRLRRLLDARPAAPAPPASPPPWVRD